MFQGKEKNTTNLNHSLVKLSDNSHQEQFQLK